MKIEGLKKLIALRHTPVKTSPGLCYGQIDVPLADSYAEDLARVQQELPQWPRTALISSPLQRCHRLAQDLNRGSVQLDRRLQELSFGSWEGQLWSNIPREVSEYWTDDVIHRAPPAGESYLDLIARVRSLLQDSALWQNHEHLLLVTHAGVIRALGHLLDGRSPDETLQEKIAFGGFKIWEF